MNPEPEKFEMQQQGPPPGFVEGWMMPNAPGYYDNVPTQNESSKKNMAKSIKHFIAMTVAITLVIVVISGLLAPLYLKLYSSSDCLAGQCSHNPVSSCSSLSTGSISGHYWVQSSAGEPVQVFCDTSGPCGIAGSWMRIASLDMSDGISNCPRSLCINTFNKRTCRLCRSNPSCSSDIYSTKGVSYSKVCGRAIAYQISTPNAFYVSTSPRSIDEIYVDGVSLTYGRPRKHIWTFAADHTENATFVDGCPCNNYYRQIVDPPNFVGTNYFCDTADRKGLSFNIIFLGDPLWDGAGCGPDNHCCTFNNPPWFYRTLSSVTSDDIEMRVCRGGERSDEDIALEIVEIYVQ